MSRRTAPALSRGSTKTVTQVAAVHHTTRQPGAGPTEGTHSTVKGGVVQKPHEDAAPCTCDQHCPCQLPFSRLPTKRPSALMEAVRLFCRSVEKRCRR